MKFGQSVVIVRQMNIPMSSPDLTETEIAAVNRVLNTPVLSIGPGAHIAPGVHLGGEVLIGEGYK